MTQLIKVIRAFRRCSLLPLTFLASLLHEASMADEPLGPTNHLYQVLKAIGDSRDDFHYQRDVKDLAVRFSLRLESTALDRELGAFKDSSSSASGRDGYVVQPEVYSLPKADFAIQFSHRALVKASSGYKPYDRITLLWKRRDDGTVELIGAELSSDKLW